MGTRWWFIYYMYLSSVSSFLNSRIQVGFSRNNSLTCIGWLESCEKRAKKAAAEVTEAKKAKEWQDWCISNKDKYDILEYQVHTAREDKQMLSILLDLGSQFTLGTKEVASFLAPILDDLSAKGMI